MQHDPHDPRREAEELGEALRQGVDAVRSEPVPQEALTRALKRAQRLRPLPTTRGPYLSQPVMALASLAATLLVGLLLVDGPPATQDPSARPSGHTHWSLNDSSLSMKLKKGLQVDNESLDREQLETGIKLDKSIAPSSRLGTVTLGGLKPNSDGLHTPNEEKKRILHFYMEAAPGNSESEDLRDHRPPPPPYLLDPEGEKRKNQDGVRFDPYLDADKDRGWGLIPGKDQRRMLEELQYDRPVNSPRGATRATSSQDDSRGGNGAGPGPVDPKKAKELSDAWGRLPEMERNKAMKDLIRDMPPAHREVVEDYFKKLSVKGTDKPALDAAKEKPARVWRQRNQRPTVARVYVGDGNALELVSMQVTVLIDGPRARTFVDHVFHNPHDRQLEGTFDYPLPTGASPSYFAMFPGKKGDTAPPRFVRRGEAPLPLPDALVSLGPVATRKLVSNDDWGNVQQGRIVSKQKALETYEEIVRGRIDPALLEYAGGNTFSGRVFPIPAKGFNRVLLAYEELLPCVGDKVAYRFPLPDCKVGELEFSLRASAAECKEPEFSPSDAHRATGGLAFSRIWTNEQPEGDVVFRYTPAQPHVQAISGRQGDHGPEYLYTRIRPTFEKVAQAQPFSHHAVFLLDTSLSEHPDRFAVNMKLLRKILESDKDIECFNILTFNVGTAWVEPKGWLANTREGRDKAFGRLDGLVLEGATDVSAALNQLVEPGFDLARGTALSVFLLSDGQITWGDADLNALVARFESRCPFPTRFHCYRTGLGAENLQLFEALTRKGGGIFNCFSEAALGAVALAHRAECFQVERVSLAGAPGASDVLVAGRKAAIYPGGDLVLAARVNGTGKGRVVLEGTYLGQRLTQEYPVEISGGAELAARGWGEIAVASLLALNDPKLDSLVTAYCQQFNIGSRVASFLVLENEADYKRLNLEEERGKTLQGDLGKFLDETWRGLAQVLSPRATFQRFLAQVDPRVKLLDGRQGAHIRKMLTLLSDQEYALPEATVHGALLHESEVPADYRAARAMDRRVLATYLAEASRRHDLGDHDGAVRVLSSVIEVFPTRGDALRLVGYRLLDLKQANHAVRLFQQVQQQRPFEPHSYRDLARSLEESGKFGLAALQYEILLAGTWHNRFHDSLKQVAQEEYAHMMQQALRGGTLSKGLADQFGERLEYMVKPQPQSDLRVTISWNTDNTDVDLWVIEPDGTKCFYQHNRTKNGGELSQDQTQGYGPERYQVTKALPGEYTIIVHYFRANPNLLAGETHVNVMVSRQAGTPQEVVERHTVILKENGEQVQVGKVKF